MHTISWLLAICMRVANYLYVQYNRKMLAVQMHNRFVYAYLASIRTKYHALMYPRSKYLTDKISNV